MTATELLLILGTIWVAPHVPRIYALTVGLTWLCVAIVKGLGWI